MYVCMYECTYVRTYSQSQFKDIYVSMYDLSGISGYVYMYHMRKSSGSSVSHLVVLFYATCNTPSYIMSSIICNYYLEL
jgi:hypothetical protein